MALRKRKTELYGCNQGLIVDDHTVVRDGLSVMLGNVEDFAVVGEARNGAEAGEMTAAEAVDFFITAIWNSSERPANWGPI